MTVPRPKIVLVNGDAALRAALRFALELDGYQVETLEDGEALMRCALPKANACIVLDHRLSDVSGFDALKVLRGRGVDLPAILLSSDTRPAAMARADACRASLVEKPLLGDALSTRIHELLPPAEPPAARP
jgi:DNA-binding response OmpR family regulator